MTFCVDCDCPSIKVSATWGQYLRETRDDKTDARTGRALKVSKRYSRGGQAELKMVAGDIKMIVPDPSCPDVYIRGQIRKRDHHTIVTLFLVNGQEESKPKDACHLFQPVLQVEGLDGSAVFQKRLLRSSKDDLEERITAMLYRHQVEFAMGHGVSVHADVGDESETTKSEKGTNEIAGGWEIL